MAPLLQSHQFLLYIDLFWGGYDLVGDHRAAGTPQCRNRSGDGGRGRNANLVLIVNYRVIVSNFCFKEPAENSLA